jgi:hypothetical protein
MTLRVADLAAPWAFTQPKATAGYGYGNFVIEDSIKLVPQLSVGGKVVATNVLMFIRVLSTWKGANYDPNFDEYGTSLIWALTDFSDFEQELQSR